LWFIQWDQGTRGGSLNSTKAGIDDAIRLADMLKQTNADGFFGDTIGSSGEYSTHALCHLGAPNVWINQALECIYRQRKKYRFILTDCLWLQA
jgi:hypothetical protein